MPFSKLEKNLTLLFILGLSLAAVISTAWLFWTPPLGGLRGHNPKTTRLMLIRQRQAAAQNRKYSVDQRWMPLSRISPHLQQAVIAAEDDAFYQHAGVDPNALWLSLQHDLKHFGFAQGGSTITQQVAKNLYLHPRKSVLRKLKEAVTALRLERALGKRRILEIYLNIVEWGRGIYGAEAAAQRYFGKSAAGLTIDEAVALAAVLPSPLRHSPVRPDRFLSWRVRLVQRQLRGRGYDFSPPAAAVPPWPEEIAAEEPEDAAGVPDDPQPVPSLQAGTPADVSGTSAVQYPEGAPREVSPPAASLEN